MHVVFQFGFAIVNVVEVKLWIEVRSRCGNSTFRLEVICGSTHAGNLVSDVLACAEGEPREAEG